MYLFTKWPFVYVCGFFPLYHLYRESTGIDVVLMHIILVKLWNCKHLYKDQCINIKDTKLFIKYGKVEQVIVQPAP